MGGIIEDKIFEVLWNKKMTAKGVQEGLEKMSESREYGTVNSHLRKMFQSSQLTRQKDHDGAFVYWNPAMVGKEDYSEA